MKQPIFPRELRHAAAQVATKSALNPGLWLSAIVSLPLFILSGVSAGNFKLIYFAAGCVPPLCTSAVMMFFAVKRPDLLQSEDYRLRDSALRIFGDSVSVNPAPGKIIEGEIILTPDKIEQIGRGHV